MGLLTHEFNSFYGEETAMKWLKEGCLEKRLRELADRIDAGEKIGMVSHLVYRYNEDYTGKFNLKQVYDEIKRDVGHAKETLKTISENQKKAKAFARATMTELGLTYDDDLDLDLGDDDDLKSDREKIDELLDELGDDLKSDDDDDLDDDDDDLSWLKAKEKDTKQKSEEKNNTDTSWWHFKNGMSLTEAEHDAINDLLGDVDEYRDPLSEAERDSIKRIFLSKPKTIDKMKFEINKLEEAIRKTRESYIAEVKTSVTTIRVRLGDLLEIAKEVYAAALATAEPTEAQLKKRKEVFIKLNTTTDKMKSQINKVEEAIRKYGPDIYNVVSDGSVWKLKYLLQIAKEAYAEATENSSEEKNDVSGADKTEENDNADNLEKELEKIKKLFEKGLIDESDYKAKKNKLLGI